MKRTVSPVEAGGLTQIRAPRRVKVLPAISPPLRRLQTGLQKLRQAAGTLKTRAEQVHDARVRTKRARAVLRLLQPYMKREVFRTRDQELKAAADALAGTRDRDVIYGELRRGVQDLEPPLRKECETWIRKMLPLRHSGTAPDWKERLKRAHAAADNVLTDVFDARMPGDLATFSCPGLCKSFRKARKAMRCADDRGRAEDFHDWRIKGKRLYLQVQILHASGLSVSEKHLKRLDKVQEKLGCHHDLVVTEAFLREKADPDSTPLTRLARAIDDRRSDLERSILRRGKRIFNRSPKGWLRRTLG